MSKIVETMLLSTNRHDLPNQKVLKYTKMWKENDKAMMIFGELGDGQELKLKSRT